MFTFRKSQITDWWITEPESLLNFSNIITQKALNKELVVVGLDRRDRELSRSDDIVVKITEDGVTTESGMFYPLKEAHELYLKFLIDVNKENHLIATKWKEIMQLSGSKKMILIADVIDYGEILEGIKFDFNPNGETKAMLTGYSNQLNSNIVLTTFSKRDVCIKIGIPQYIKDDIYDIPFTTLKQHREMIKAVEKLISESKF